MRDGEAPEEALARLANDVAGNVIAVQGPPGSGKTYQAARLICGLLRQGKRVGVTANSHAVIKHLLERVCEQAAEAGEMALVRALHLDNEDADDKPYPFRIHGSKGQGSQRARKRHRQLVGRHGVDVGTPRLRR